MAGGSSRQKMMAGGSSRQMMVVSPHDDRVSDDDSEVSGSYAEDVSTENSEPDLADLMNDGTSSNNSHTSLLAEPQQPIRQLQDKFTADADHAVSWTRGVLFAAVILAGIAGSLSTIYVTRKADEQAYEPAFETAAVQIVTSLENRITTASQALNTFSLSIATLAQQQNSTFPFFTHPNFEILGGNAKQTGNLDVVLLAPFVESNQLEEWEQYTLQNAGWIEQSLKYQQGKLGAAFLEASKYMVPSVHPTPETNFLPVWQLAEVPNDATEVSELINLNLYSRTTTTSSSSPSSLEHMAGDVVTSQQALLSGIGPSSLNVNKRHSLGSYIMQPIIMTMNYSVLRPKKVVATLLGTFSWEQFLSNILPQNVQGITVVVHDGCGTEQTFQLQNGNFVISKEDNINEAATAGAAAVPVPPAPAKFGELHYSADLASDLSYSGVSTLFDTELHCKYNITVLPTADFEAWTGRSASNGTAYALAVAAFFVAVFALLTAYDSAVYRRHKRLSAMLKRTTTLISSLFPKNIQLKMMENVKQEERKVARQANNNKKNNNSKLTGSSDRRIASNITDVTGATDPLSLATLAGIHNKCIDGAVPIAELYLETTVFMSDIVGFTAWSSTRSPSQVFTLLETVYRAFDAIADTRHVFKVETVGDCYVAVVGLPTARKDHAVVMARFAWQCLSTFSNKVREMETTLGPDTGDLGIRMGLHSGPVIAGVLRGERARFQLFGDTVNTAGRMESTGNANSIHLTSDTAELIIAGGKKHWVEQRPEKIFIKGKGNMQTYFLNCNPAPAARRSLPRLVRENSHGSVESVTNNDTTENDDGGGGGLVERGHQNIRSTFNLTELDAEEEKQKRLIDWNTDTLLGFLKEIEARRDCTKQIDSPTLERLRTLESQRFGCPLDEVEEIITLPKFTAKPKVKDVGTIDLGDRVKSQLRSYVSAVAHMYQKNPFHNFEHASHVAMSTIKLLSRIVAPKTLDSDDEDEGRTLHDHTYGITSDPLTQFACIFSAMIHDADHSGVPNGQLIQENSKLSLLYNEKSIAEQNSVDLAWGLLMSSEYEVLRRVIYQTEDEFKRFRQLVVNVVLATDIMDKDLKALRNGRWAKAFDESHRDSDELVATNRKATIVIEHLIQASDVAHTMQHWHVYRKWNERFFIETYKAWKQGRAEKNPAESWYNGEIGFFDFYIIPLAKKLKDCGVFGISSDEYLNYAQRNRNEWESKGREVVESMLEIVESMDFSRPQDQKQGPKGSRSSSTRSLLQSLREPMEEALGEA